MSVFLWTVIVLWALGILARLVCLAGGVAPPRPTLSGMAIGVVVHVAFIIWAVTLL